MHNTLLHFQNTQKANTNNTSTNEITQPINQNDSEILRSHTVQTIANEVAFTTKSAFTKPMILLSTAMVKISDKYRNLPDYKVLLDSGSQSSFILEKLCKILDLPSNKTDFFNF